MKKIRHLFFFVCYLTKLLTLKVANLFIFGNKLMIEALHGLASHLLLYPWILVHL